MSVKVIIEWEDGVAETYETRGLWRKEQCDEEEMTTPDGRVVQTRVATQVELSFTVASRTITKETT